MYRITSNNSPWGVIFQPPSGGGELFKGGELFEGGELFFNAFGWNFLNFLFKFPNFFVKILQFLTKNLIILRQILDF